MTSVWKPQLLPCSCEPCTIEDTCADGVCEGGAPKACDDGQYCNGIETCVLGAGCTPGAPIAIDDGVACTVDSCDEVADKVVNEPNNLNCEAEGPCSEAVCSPVVGCEAVTVQDCCGNNILEQGETCDDGNALANDGCSPNCQSEGGEIQFNFTGEQQTFTVPPGVFTLEVELFGASGGLGEQSGAGGLGGQVKATLPVSPGSVLYVWIGAKGGNFNQGAFGGSNGGGTGGTGATCGSYGGGGGGGASDIRTGESLDTRIAVAGGGGGGGAHGNCACARYGGAGGGLIGAFGEDGANDCDPSGKGGTQSAGGAVGKWSCSNCNSTPGQFGKGGAGNTSNGCGGCAGGNGGCGGGSALPGRSRGAGGL